MSGSTRAKHDANLDKCLQRLAMKGLLLNQSKCDFLSGTLSFFGQVFLEECTRPDPQRVTDLLNAPQPNNAHDVRSLLYLAWPTMVEIHSRFRNSHRSIA